MTRGERQVTHAALTWATRRGGWQRGITRHAYSRHGLDLIWWEPQRLGEFVVDLDCPPFRLTFSPESPRQAIDVLAALNLLPAHFATNYAAGRARGRVEQWEEATPCMS